MPAYLNLGPTAWGRPLNAKIAAMATRDDSDDYSLAFALRQKRQSRNGAGHDADQISPALGFKATAVEIVFTLAGFLGVIILVTICVKSLGFH
jgi:hypothetical protein